MLNKMECYRLINVPCIKSKKTAIDPSVGKSRERKNSPKNMSVKLIYFCIISEIIPFDDMRYTYKKKKQRNAFGICRIKIAQLKYMCTFI